MARIRTIKPDFWTDEKIVDLSPFARLLFIGIWNFVDDWGRAEYSPKKLKMQILPADPVEVSELLGEIRGENLIELYEVDNKQYFRVRGFDRHQKVDKRSQSKIPAPPNPPESPRIPAMEKEGEREKEGNSSSEPNGSGTASAPVVIQFPAQVVDARKTLFAEGLQAVAEFTGKPPPSCRSLLGRWLKVADDDAAKVLDTIRKAIDFRVADPVPWIEAALRPKDPDEEIYRGVQ